METLPIRPTPILNAETLIANYFNGNTVRYFYFSRNDEPISSNPIWGLVVEVTNEENPLMFEIKLNKRRPNQKFRGMKRRFFNTFLTAHHDGKQTDGIAITLGKQDNQIVLVLNGYHFENNNYIVFPIRGGSGGDNLTPCKIPNG